MSLIILKYKTILTDKLYVLSVEDNKNGCVIIRFLSMKRNKIYK